MHLVVIYALSIDGSTFRYVGQTNKGAAARLRRHLKNARCGSERGAVYDWIRKYDALDVPIQTTVLEICAESELNDREIFWIAKLKADGHQLLNHTAGGKGITGMKIGPMTDEHKMKIRQAHLGRKQTPEHLAALKAAREARTAEQRATLSAAISAGRRTGKKPPGQPRSLETRAKIAAGQTGRAASEETKAKLRAAWERRKARSAVA